MGFVIAGLLLLSLMFLIFREIKNEIKASKVKKNMKKLNQCIDIPPTIMPFTVFPESSNHCGHVPGNGIDNCGG